MERTRPAAKQSLQSFSLTPAKNDDEVYQKGYLTPHAANYVIAQNGRKSSIIHKAFARDKQVTEASPRPTITKEKLSFLDVSLPGVA